ncbi:MAG: glycosyltransferase family 4 protein [Pseudomonadota bacterium]
MTFNKKRKLLFVANVDWFFLSHRLPIAQAALQNGYEVHIATGITDKFIELQMLGLKVHPLVISRSSTGIKNAFQTMWQFKKIFQELNPDIIHLVTIKPVLLGGLVARFVKAKAVVAAVSGLGFVFIARGKIATLRRACVGILYRLALGHPNIKVIFQNLDDKNSISEFAHLSDKNTVLIRGSGVELDEFKCAPLSGGRPIVLLASRMLIDKGVQEFIEAVKFIQRNIYSFKEIPRFVLVGQPDPANPMSLTQAQLNGWQLEGIVELWGQRADMHTVLSSACIVVLPSYREGLPKVLIEAAACGRAVITTDVPGCRDAIIPNVTGLLVPVKNANALAEAINSLLKDKERCEKMGKAGRDFAEKTFDVKNVVQEHLRIYEELLNNSANINY